MKKRVVSVAVALNDIQPMDTINEQRTSVPGRKLVLTVFALTFSSVVLGMVGFAPGYAHNAAHDTRHVMVFPCH